MTFVCLWIPDWSIGAASSADPGRRPDGADDSGRAPPADQVSEALLRAVPRLVVAERGMIWADARGLAERPLALRACAILRSLGAARVRAGVARTAIAAEVAAGVDGAFDAATDTRAPGVDPVVIVPPGEDRPYLAPRPLTVLVRALGGAGKRCQVTLLPLLAGVGIETCGDLAALAREELEVRFGADGVRLWRLARAEDPRRPFGALSRSLPRASCAWTDYALRDAERLLFVLHRLVGQVCETLWARGEGARILTLRFSLANRSTVEHPLQATHPTADRAAWMRLVRAGMERLRLPDAVTGLAVRVSAACPIHDRQGDLFDRGFATARAAEHAVAQLLDACGPDVVTLAATDHPLPERRARWQVRESVVLDGATAYPATGAVTAHPSLALQLLPEPRPVAVVTTPRRDHDVPVRYREPSLRPAAAVAVRRGHPGPSRGTKGSAHRVRGATAQRSMNGVVVEVLAASGPDRIDGGSWEVTPHAREYFHCITADGRLVLLFREAGLWYLHGWWD